jgi:hypothetical protein
MKWYRKFTGIALALVLVAGVSCTSDTTGVDAPAGPQTPAEPTVETSLLLGDLLGGLVEPVGGLLDLLGGVVRGVLDITGLLDCSAQAYDVEYETVGPWGGSVRVGNHLLVIPRGALTQYVRIKAEQIPGSTNSVRFSPEGLTFKKSAVLTLSYGNCSNVEFPKAIVYTTEDFNVLEIMLSVDFLRWKKVTAPIDHFSRYAVAY